MITYTTLAIAPKVNSLIDALFLYKFTSCFFDFRFLENFSTALYNLNDVKFNTASFKIPLYSLLYSSAFFIEGKYFLEKYISLDIQKVLLQQ